MVPVGKSSLSLLRASRQVRQPDGRMKAAKKAHRQPDSGATTGYEAELWAMANALLGSMDAAEYKHTSCSDSSS